MRVACEHGRYIEHPVPPESDKDPFWYKPCPGGRSPTVAELRAELIRLDGVDYEAVEALLTTMLRGIARDLRVPLIGQETIPEMAHLYANAALGVKE